MHSQGWPTLTPPPNYGIKLVQVRNTSVLPLHSSPCRGALGAKTHRPAVPSRVTRTASPGRLLLFCFLAPFFPRQVLRGLPRADDLQDSSWPHFCPPFGVFCLGGSCVFSPFCAPPCPLALISDDELCPQAIELLAATASGLLAYPTPGVFFGMVFPPLCFFQQAGMFTPSPALCFARCFDVIKVFFIANGRNLTTECSRQAQFGLSVMHCLVWTQLHGSVCRGGTVPLMANLYAMTPLPCCRQPPKQALQRLSWPQRS